MMTWIAKYWKCMAALYALGVIAGVALIFWDYDPDYTEPL